MWIMITATAAVASFAIGFWVSPKLRAQVTPVQPTESALSAEQWHKHYQEAYAKSVALATELGLLSEKYYALKYKLEDLEEKGII